MMRYTAIPGFLLLVLLAGCQTNLQRQADKEPSPATRAAMINVQLGTGYMESNRNELAMNKLQKAVALDPNLASAHHALAMLYERLGEIEPADKQYKLAVKLDPNDSNAFNTYGVFLCRQKRFDEADAQFTAALKNPLYQTPEFAYANAGICALDRPDYAKAEGYLRKALEINPAFASALLEMARLHQVTNRSIDARGYLEAYHKVAGQTPQSLWLGVQIERSLGNGQAAMRYADALRQYYPQSAEARGLQAGNTHGPGSGQ
jgi:type IV pilus assembly protein PilF